MKDYAVEKSLHLTPDNRISLSNINITWENEKTNLKYYIYLKENFWKMQELQMMENWEFFQKMISCE